MIVLDETGVLEDIKRDEGFKATPYRDTAGLWTIGYGTNIDSGISHEEAEFLLRSRLSEIVGELDKRKPSWRGHRRSVQRALMNMAYNLGTPRLLGFVKMWAALDKKDYETAAAEALDSRWATQVGDRATQIAWLIRGETTA